MRRLLTAGLLLVVTLSLTSAGCYTVLKHPTGEVVAEGSYYRSCADCHADASFYHPYGHPYYRYGRSHYGWSGYYGYPWWYDDYWWWDQHGHDDHDGGDGPEVETGTRHLWSSDGWASGGWGFVKPGTPPRLPTPPSSEPRKDDGKKEEQKQEEKKENKDDRSLWTKPKKGF